MLLNSSEFTVWDRPWAPHEEIRASCCCSAEDREELGRLRYPGEPLSHRVKLNPILQAEEKGGGLFELDWRERAKLLRQLVDWQCKSSTAEHKQSDEEMQVTHAESIRTVINREFKVGDGKGTKKPPVEPIEDGETIVTNPLGQDRDKQRIWALDSEFDHRQD